MAKDINSLQAGTFQQDGVNDPSVRVIRGKNLFPQSHYHASTCRYGEVDPVMAFRAERGDTIDYRFVTDLNTFTMASPLKSDVNMYTAAFKVPMEAIYPRNWDIMLPIPLKGDDTPSFLASDNFPADRCRALLPFNVLVSNVIGAASAGFSEGSSVGISFGFRCLFLLQSLLSSGCLFAKFNMHTDCLRFYIKYNEVEYSSCDDWFDAVIAPYLLELFGKYPDFDSFQIVSVDEMFSSTSVSGFHVVTPSDGLEVGKNKNISFSRAIELLLSGDYVLNPNVISLSDASVLSSLVPSFLSANGGIVLNIESIIAYQLCCSHFFVNSKVDFVYTAALFRDNQEALCSNVLSSFGDLSFTFNGVNRLYDVFSYDRLNAMSSVLSYVGIVSGSPYNISNEMLSFWYNLFTFKRSLRYGDYFTGAHVEPLAVGDINAPVTDGSVSALDITRKLQLTRLLNKINITGQRISDYLTALFGGAIPTAPDDVPIRLSLEKFDISGFEVNNTGSDQLSTSVDSLGSKNITTTNLRLNDSKFMFEVDIDKPCWIICVQYFDAHRIYCRTMDRFALHYNRYDDFIPDMQFVGDQSVYLSELNLENSLVLNYAYNLRYMEYKNRYSYASGGFVNSLKTWALVTDNRDGSPIYGSINSEYIRSSPSEFDRFYKSLTGYSYGSRFHFITFNTNIVNAYRQMVFAPEILA